MALVNLFRKGVLPRLRRGTGAQMSRGGCVMQVVNYLSTGGWSDAPVCVLPHLRSAAIIINDTVNSKARQRLWPLVPKLMNTSARNRANEDGKEPEQAASEDARVTRLLMDFRRGRLKELAWGYPSTASMQERTWYRSADIRAFRDPIGELEAELEEYDRITGRRSEEQVIDAKRLDKIIQTMPSTYVP